MAEHAAPDRPCATLPAFGFDGHCIRKGIPFRERARAPMVERASGFAPNEDVPTLAKRTSRIRALTFCAVVDAQRER